MFEIGLKKNATPDRLLDAVQVSKHTPLHYII